MRICGKSDSFIDDRSRIRLMSKAEDDIDANLVDGVDRSGAYVATKVRATP